MLINILVASWWICVSVFCAKWSHEIFMEIFLHQISLSFIVEVVLHCFDSGVNDVCSFGSYWTNCLCLQMYWINYLHACHCSWRSIHKEIQLFGFSVHRLFCLSFVLDQECFSSCKCNWRVLVVGRIKRWFCLMFIDNGFAMCSQGQYHEFSMQLVNRIVRTSCGDLQGPWHHAFHQVKHSNPEKQKEWGKSCRVQ